MNSSHWSDHFIHIGHNGAERYREAIADCTQALSELFETTERPYSGLPPADLERRLHHIDLSAKAVSPLTQVIKEVRDEIARHAIVVQHPHCIAHLHTPPMLSGVAAENFIAAQNLSMDSWDQSGSATYVEQHVIHYLCALFGYPKDADGVFTSGGTQSNMMALLIARDDFVLRHFNRHVQVDGLPSDANKLRILASENSHFTVEKAAAVMGLGRQAVVKVATDADGGMNTQSLEDTIKSLLADGLLPFVVVGTAGTTDHGALDRLNDISRIAKRYGMWFHVDAAYGGALILGRAKERLTGIEHADSMVVDFHKLWFQPVSCGALLLRHHANFKYLQYKSHYLNRDTDDLPNLVDKTVATTRRFDALKVYMMLRVVGTETLGAMVDHLLHQTQTVAEKICAATDFELLAKPSLTTVLFRYIALESQAQYDAFNRQLRAELLKRGIAVLGETTVNQSAALKLTLLNPCLKDADFDQLLKKISQFAQTLLKETS